jgi:transaldolase / glucose-6-phosphate isomerase
MAHAIEVNERLQALTEAGTSIWLDQIRRSLIETGELERMVREESLRGVTSNPAIFEKSILGADEYDSQIEEMTKAGADARGLYRAIAAKDVQDACDVLRPVWEGSGHADGFVSLEVDPDLAHDTDLTVRQAHEYWDAVDRPNLMIKIPGTDAGVPAIEQVIAAGLNVNVTLLFSVESYSNIAEAFIKGMEARLERGESLDVHSVASFFVSRVDSEVDKRLKAMGGHDELLGTAGLANARAAYQRFKEIFYGDRYARLRDAGAKVQRPLWASTGVKNPAYSPTMYVDGLVAPDTVNTMPMDTILAAARGATITGPTADQDPTEDLAALAAAGIDMEEVTRKLLDDGITAFVTPMEKLLAGIESKREAIVTHRPPAIESALPDDLEPAIAKRIAQAHEERIVKRIWAKDDTVFGPAGQEEVSNRLGWLTIASRMADEVEDLEAFAAEVREAGYTDVVLLGMGGSSLAPEVLKRSFAGRVDGLELTVLDSTDADAVRAATDRDLDTTLVLVSTKSGGTIETLSAFQSFWSLKPEGDHYVAITDPGSSLVAIAREHGFRRVFENDPDIGGRYSALSYFGLVPAALMGIDVEALLSAAGEAEQACNSFEGPNSGLWLGACLGELALAGRDKLTFVIGGAISSFGLWVEQLVAESTGKEGRGILPVAGEPLGEPGDYGEDRTFVHLHDPDGEDDGTDAKIAALAKAGHPVITVTVKSDPVDLGRIFFFAEFATAIAGWVLGINPFDQPNVAEAKDATSQVLNGAVSGGGEVPSEPDASDDALRALLEGGPPAYVAVRGYTAESPELDDAVAGLRVAIRDRTKVATTFGYGPRFLHSTGQLHKGGAATGRFLQLFHPAAEDLEVPTTQYTFETLKAAQALGDLRTLRAHDLPAERITLQGDPVAAVHSLTDKIKGL